MTTPASPSAPVSPGAVIAVYVMADRANGAVRIGLTTDLHEHAHQNRAGAPRKLGRVDDRRRLVWFETHDRLASAVTREQALLAWRAEWITALIEADNPQWRDLAAAWFDSPDAETVMI